MDKCRYCHREVDAGARTCEDCTDYEAAVRIAANVLQDSEVESGSLAASLGAEIMREYFLRSIRGTRVRHIARPETEMLSRRQRPLV